MALVYHMPEAQLNAWLATRVPRHSSRSGGLIISAEIEPITADRYSSWRDEGLRTKRRNGRKRRTFRDN